MTRLYRAILAFVLSSTTLHAYNPSQINRRHLLQSVTSASATTLVVPSSPSLALPKSPVPLVDVGKCKVSKTIQGVYYDKNNPTSSFIVVVCSESIEP